ncbi:hypothetical protein PIB30_017897 [Stylosanthes scabra]|uniref:Transmembrane protein n=1 Tax=Stylosanthes scabra TaxID=79078 RepID=A0ABU6Z783_9FABA|nr:hypothetical protein [Stylosanthes scabra]
MAKTKRQKPKKKTASIFLCCFGAPPNTPPASTMEPTTINKKRSTWISRLTIRIRNTSCKTVPLQDHHYSNPIPKSTLRHNNNKPQPLPPPPLPPHPPTPYYTPSQTRHGASKKRAEERREEGNESKGEEREAWLLLKKKKQQHQKKWVVGMSIIAVTLVIMVCWGRLCAILCTSAWLYYIPRFNTSATASQNVDLDSEEYKKKVIMDGILHRNRGITNK